MADVCPTCGRDIVLAPNVSTAEGLTEAENAMAALDPDDEDREATRADLSHDIAQYLLRYDSHNVDTTVDPIDLLREVDAMMEEYDRDLEAKDQLIEKLKAGESEQLVKLQLEVQRLEALDLKVQKNNWIKRLLDRTT